MTATIKTETHNKDALCNDLRFFLDTSGNSEYVQIQEIIQKVEAIRTRILDMASLGKTCFDGRWQRWKFPIEKIQEGRQCFFELQKELRKIFGIHQVIAKRWEVLKIDEGLDQETIQSVVAIVIEKYQERHSDMGCISKQLGEKVQT